MIDLNFIRVNDTAQPADILSAERFAAIPNHGGFSAKVHVPRTPLFNGMAHALLKLVADNNTEYPTPDALRRFLQLRCFQYETFIKKGEPILMRQSLNFGDMDEIEFREIYGAWVRVICEEVIPGMVPAHLETEVRASL